MSLGNLARKGIEVFGTEAMGVPVSVGSVRVSLVTSSVTISDLVIGNPEGYTSPHALSLDKVSLKMNPRSLRKDLITIDAITVDAPRITYELGVGGTNIRTLQNRLRRHSDQSPAEGSSNSKKVVIRTLDITNAQAEAVIPNTSKTVTLPDIHLEHIGEEGQGVSFAAAATEVFAALTQALTKSDLQPFLVEGIGASLREAADGAKGLLEDVGSSLRDAFGGR